MGQEVVSFLVPVGVDKGEDSGFEEVEVFVRKVGADGAKFIVAELSNEFWN